jgi:hypothetical protein
MMMKRTVRYAAAGIGVAALIGGAGTGIVLAQSGGGNAAPANNVYNLLQQDQPGAADSFIAELAKNLGITEQQLRDALKKTSLDKLDKLVADGKLTQDAADKIKSRIEDGTAPLFGLGGEGRGHRGGPDTMGGGFGLAGAGADAKAVADFLGTTPQQIGQDLASGKTPAEVAQAHGKSRDDLKQFVIDQSNTRIQQAVDAGKLTTDKATELKNQVASNVDKWLDSKLEPRGFGGRGFGMPHMDKGFAPSGGPGPSTSPGNSNYN